MKRVCALCICLAMALGIGTARAEESAVPALLAQWREITLSEEKSLFAMDWALDYAEGYCKSGSWNDLVLARAAAQAAFWSLAGLERPGRQLTPEQTYDLTLKGVETALALNEAAAFYEKQTLRLGTLTALRTKLNQDVCFSRAAKEMGRWVAIEAQWAARSAVYHCLETNYLLAGLEADPAVGAFWRDMPRDYPFIGAAQGAWQTDKAALEESGSDLLDGLEALEQESAKLVASAADELLHMEAAYASGDWARMLENYRLIDEMPPLLPLPEGLSAMDATCLFYSQEDSEKIRAIEPGDDLEAIGELICALQFQAFAHGALERYCETLEQCGASLAGSGISDSGSEQFRFTYGQGMLTVIWQEETLLLYYSPRDVGVVELWYYATAQQLAAEEK